MTAMIIPLPGASQKAMEDEEDRADAEMLSLELRRARIRIAQLEASLTEAMRDNLANFNRAREAERRLEKVEA